MKGQRGEKLTEGMKKGRKEKVRNREARGNLEKRRRK